VGQQAHGHSLAVAGGFKNETDRTSYQSLPWSLLRSAFVLQFLKTSFFLGAPNGDPSFNFGLSPHGLFSFL
jgi:hypothetical protein